MTKHEFHDRLRQLLHREPFVPFAVELRDGGRIVVERPPVVFADGAASFIDPTDGALVEFFHKQVKDFSALEKEKVK
jgi:hypothetical protein